MAPSWCVRVQPFIAIILYVFLSVYSTYYVSSLKTNKSVREMNELKKTKMAREYLQKINKPAKKTIKSPDGDLIDCVPFHKQPAFDNPILKVGKISMVPPKMSKSFNSTYTFQLWNANGDECPEGTIAIRRTTEEDILRDARFERFRMKRNRFSNRDNKHEYANAKSDKGRWSKSKATLGIWKPYVDASRDEFSLCQLWVSAGLSINQVNSIEAGWIVYPDRHRDSETRFFIYWTNNSYLPGYGCYNLRCPGFVQISNALVPGAVFNESRISVYGGAQHDLTLSIEWRVDRNWWLYWHTDQGVFQLGYWPGSMFPHLNGPAERLDYGGEVNVFPDQYTGLHSMTKMGSGHFSMAGLTRAAYVSHIEMNGFSTIMPHLGATNYYCYDTNLTHHPELGISFFYGGPGYGGRCRDP